MGGSTSTTDSSGTSSQINQIPQWMSDAGQQNYALAQNIALQPLQQYQGQMVADVAPQTQQYWDLAANSGNVGADQYNSATSGYLNSLAQSPYAINATQSGLSQSALAAPTTAAQASTAQAAAAQQAALAAPTQASTANLSTLAGMNLNPYLSPYTQDVINKTLPIMNQSLQQQQNAIQNQANSANAFGGSRQAINQGVLGAQGAQSEAQMAAQLNQANYAQAQQAGMYDVGQANNMGQFNANQLNQVGMYNQGQANTVGMYNAGQGNQVNVANAQMANAANQFNAGQSNQVGMYNQGQANQMGQFNATAANNMGQFNAQAQNTAAGQNQAAQQAKINSDILASQGLTNTGTAMNAANVANAGLLASAGAQQQTQAQNQINAQIAKFQQAFNYPQAQLGVLEGSLGMTPHDTSQFGQTQNTSTTTQSPDIASMALGGLQSAASIFPMLPTSDKTLKTDITALGKDPKTGLKMSAFRYKGDPKSYPKVVGPMAQDVEEKYPGKTQRVGGKLTVSPDVMSAAGVKGYAAGTPFVPPSIGAFAPPSSPGVAKGISALGAFRPPVRMSRGYGVPHMQRFAFGTPQVPGQGLGDTVPAMLTPGEAVLTSPAAQRVGRAKIAALNAGRPIGALANRGKTRTPGILGA